MATPPLSSYNSNFIWKYEKIHQTPRIINEKKEEKTMNDDLKQKVEKIRDNRKSLIKEIINLLQSDVIFLNYNKEIKPEFTQWLCDMEYIQKCDTIKIEVKKRKKTLIKTEVVFSKEYLILRNLQFKISKDKGHYIYFEGEDEDWNYYHDENKPQTYSCPYTKQYNFYINSLNGDVWIKYETILNKIKNAILPYSEFFYQKELTRLCDKQYTHVCEACGSKNENCAIYCNICGVKLHE